MGEQPQQPTEFAEPARRKRKEAAIPSGADDDMRVTRLYAPAGATGEADPLGDSDLDFSSSDDDDEQPLAMLAAAAAAEAEARAAEAGAASGQRHALPPATHRDGRPVTDWLAANPAQVAQHSAYVTLEQQVQQLSKVKRTRLQGASPAQAGSLPAELQCLLPQHSPHWHALRSGVLTASSAPAALGFFEKRACKELNLPGTFADHGRAKQLYSQAGSLTDSAATPPMLWGTAHEANARLLLLEGLTSLKPFQGKSFKLLQCGMQRKKVLPDGLPLLGASPDDILTVGSGPAREEFVVEYKCQWPFTRSSGGGYRFNKNLTPPKRLCPTHFAQLQLQMLVFDATQALLVHVGTGSTHVWCVPRDQQWCDSMISIISRLTNTYWGPQGAQLPQDFGSGATDDQASEYSEFLRLTNSLLAKAKLIGSLKGIINMP